MAFFQQMLLCVIFQIRQNFTCFYQILLLVFFRDHNNHNGDDDEKLNNGDSVSDLESIESLNLQDVDSQPMKFLNRSSHQTTTKSYSSPTSPKIMISTCNDSKLIINQNSIL